MTDLDSPADGRRFARIALAVALALLGFWISASFLAALVWALILAIAIDPLYLRLRNARPGSGRVLLPLAVVLVFALAVLVPLAFGISQAAREAQDLAGWIAAAQANGVPVPAWIARLPYGSAQATTWWQAHLATPGGAGDQLQLLGRSAWLTHSRLIGSSLVHRAVIFAFTLLTLFFLLRDRDAIVAQLRLAGDRLFGPAGERIGVQAIRSVRGTIDGLVLVGIGEGAVMAVVYMLLGVPHPLLLGAVTAVAAMIPFGAVILFAIAAALLLVQGSVGGAIAVMVIGLGVVGIADHFLRPALIGGATRLPFIWVLIGILGGVETFGLLGLFIGPAVMAILVMMWREFLEPAVNLGTQD